MWLNPVSQGCSYDSGLVAKLCPTLCDSMDCSLPGSSVHGISQPGILEWVAVFFSKGSSRSGDQACISCIASVFFTAEPPGKPQDGRQSCNHLRAQLGRICFKTDSHVIGRIPFLTGCWTGPHFHPGYWLEASLSYLPPGLLHRATDNMATWPLAFKEMSEERGNEKQSQQSRNRGLLWPYLEKKKKKEIPSRCCIY